jgi:hypothetical protein
MVVAVVLTLPEVGLGCSGRHLNSDGRNWQTSDGHWSRHGRLSVQGSELSKPAPE